MNGHQCVIEITYFEAGDLVGAFLFLETGEAGSANGRSIRSSMFNVTVVTPSSSTTSALGEAFGFLPRLPFFFATTRNSKLIKRAAQSVELQDAMLAKLLIQLLA